MFELPKDKLIYLASPYTSTDPEKVIERFEAVCRASATLMKAGYPIFSPIAHTHPLVKYGLPGDWGFWENYDRLWLRFRACEVLAVLMLDGWDISKGVQAEIKIAEECGMVIVYLDPSDVLRPILDIKKCLRITKTD